MANRRQVVIKDAKTGETMRFNCAEQLKISVITEKNQEIPLFEGKHFTTIEDAPIPCQCVSCAR